MSEAQVPPQKPYDPLDYDTWPEEQQAFAGRVWRGLHDGDLRPLAAYLRAGHYIEPALAGEIADAIEQKEAGYFHIIARGRHRGQQSMSVQQEGERERLEIGAFLEGRMRALGQGSYESAMEDALVKFRCSRTKIAAAHRYLKDEMEQTVFHDGRDPWDGWFCGYYRP